MSWEDTFFKRSRLVAAGAFILLEESVLFRFYTAWGLAPTDTVGMENGWWGPYRAAGAVVLGICMAIVFLYGRMKVSTYFI